MRNPNTALLVQGIPALPAQIARDVAPSTDFRGHAFVAWHLSATESQAWRLEIASGRTTQVLPAPGSSEKSTCFAGGFTPDGGALDVVSDRYGGFRELLRYRFADRSLQRVSGHIPWDVSGASATEDGGLIAVQANVEGRDELRLFDGRSLAERPAPKLPPGAASGR